MSLIQSMAAVAILAVAMAGVMWWADPYRGQVATVRAVVHMDYRRPPPPVARVGRANEPAMINYKNKLNKFYEYQLGMAKGRSVLSAALSDPELAEQGASLPWLEQNLRVEKDGARLVFSLRGRNPLRLARILDGVVEAYVRAARADVQHRHKTTVFTISERAKPLNDQDR